MHSTPDSLPTQPADTASALWNPGAVAGWSLVFTPAFGAWLLMRNWEALGLPHQAIAARKWFCFSLGLLVVQLLSAAINARLNSQSTLMHWVALLYLLVWYLAAALPQARLVKSRFGPAYPRKPWDPVLLAAVAAGTMYFCADACLSLLLIALT
jgi:hypothetical protein